MKEAEAFDSFRAGCSLKKNRVWSIFGLESRSWLRGKSEKHDGEFPPSHCVVYRPMERTTSLSRERKFVCDPGYMGTRQQRPNRTRLFEKSGSAGNMRREELLREKRDEILRIATRHGARNVRVFGSVARGEADEEKRYRPPCPVRAGSQLARSCRIMVGITRTPGLQGGCGQ